MNNMPAPLGVLLSGIDYRYRLGPDYSMYSQECLMFGGVNFNKFKKLVEFSQKNIKFYNDFYRLKNFSFEDLRSPSDIVYVPIVSKSDLQSYVLDDRCSRNFRGIRSNTGGTTGQPLDFKLDSRCYAREWAHMHAIWAALDYKPSSIKLTFRGLNLGDEPVKYFFNQNEFQVNAYCPFDHILISLSLILDRYDIQYLHGYPSAILEFLENLNKINKNLLFKLRINLKGVFLGSEYPSPHCRARIEQLSGVSSVSWYGHSEMVVLAYERSEPYLYEPFPSYGLAESVVINGKHHLVGTSLDNYACPLIRYDTGDIVEPIQVVDGVLKSFKISEGRIGEYVTDNGGRNISLTALIFGRHHDIFGFANFVQIFQSVAGVVDIFVVTDLDEEQIRSKFDFTDVDLDVRFHKRILPKKTCLGKVPLLLKEFYETSNSNP